MRFGNPTALQVGMSGALLGTTYNVAGRVVMGMEEEGETYFWNEFNMVSAEGIAATLVYEESQGGGVWRLFRMFEPECELTAEDAASKRVGDPLNLDGTDVRVTLVDESRVYHIEGQAPEGVEVGDVARYFNAEAGDTMMVVSWTNEEVECYHGEDLSAEIVNSAFNLQSATASSISSFLNAQDSAPSSAVLKKVVLGFLALVVAISGFAMWFSKRTVRAPKRTSAPATQLSVGVTGTMDNRKLRVQSHALVELARVGTLGEQHEYELVDQNGDDRMLLVSGFTPERDDWWLLSPFNIQYPLTPTQAAQVKAGQTVSVDGQAFVVRDLFQITVRQVEPSGSKYPALGDFWYGFLGWSGSTPFMARWNNQGITYFRGKTLLPADLKSAFKP